MLINSEILYEFKDFAAIKINFEFLYMIAPSSSTSHYWAKSRQLKNVREESEGSCSVHDSNVFDEGLDDSDCNNILHNCLKKIEIRFTENFHWTDTINEKHY